jgi:hypothetical protein
VGQEVNEKDTRAIPSGYLRDFISITKKACSIGREKRVTFACRNNISKKEIEFLIDKHKITDIVSIPGHDGAGKASLDLINACKNFGVKLTSIEIKSNEAEKDIIYDMVGKKRAA